MFFIKLILSFIFFFLIPILLGKLITYFRKEKNEIIFEIILGYMIKFAILEIIAIPLILLKISFTLLLAIYLILIIIASIISIVLNFKNIKEKIKTFKINLKENLALKLCLLILIFVQVFHVVYFTHIDDDDAVYVAQSLTSIETNTLYQMNPSQGNNYGIYMRYALSPFPMYISITSIFTGIHSTIIWHTILSGIMVILSYFVYYLFGKKLFKQENKNLVFLIILSIINIFGNFSQYTTFSYFLLRPWQGKSVLINLILPFLWYIFLDITNEEKRYINWIILYITVFAACLVSGMGIVLTPISLAILAIVFFFKDKNYKYLLKTGIGLIPCVIFAILYILN